MKFIRSPFIPVFVSILVFSCHGLKSAGSDPFMIHYDSSKLKLPNTVYPHNKVDSKVTYVDGEAALLAYIHSNLNYPAEARAAGKQGISVVRVFTDDLGMAMNKYLITKPLGYGMDEAALEVVSELDDKWKPAIYQGNPVRSYVDVPVKFELH